MIRLALRKVEQFPVEDTGALERALCQLEDYVCEALRVLASVAMPFWTPVKVFADYTAHIGEMVVADSTTANIILTLPEATANNAGQPIAVVYPVALGTVNVRATPHAGGVACNVQGASVDTGIAGLGVGMYVYASDGAAWWRTL